MKNQQMLVLFFLLAVEFATAQNARFSQIGSAPMLLNPALTGRFDGKARVGTLFSWQKTQSAKMEHQNVSFDIKLGQYRTSGDQELIDTSKIDIYTGKPTIEAKDLIDKDRKKMGYWGVGFNYYHYGDTKGPLSASFFSASLARHFYNKKNKYFGFGVQATYAEGRLDETKGLAYDREISGGTFLYPRKSTPNYISSKNYIDFNGGAYYGMVTEAVMFEIGGAMYHLFYPKNDIYNKDSETKLRHRITAYSTLRLKLNSKWGIVQKNMYWQEGLYYRSNSLEPVGELSDREIVSFWSGVEFYKVNPHSNYNVNFGFYTRSFRTLMPYLNINIGKVANLRYSYELPINSNKFRAYTAKRSEIALILSYKRYSNPGTRFYKKMNFW